MFAQDTHGANTKNAAKQGAFHTFSLQNGKYILDLM